MIHKPVFSPDGRQIAFWEAGDYVYIMNADGTNVRRLAAGSYPDFSPDGKKIVFVGRGISIMNADGTDVRPVTVRGKVGEHGDMPKFSPDGSQIVFHATPGYRTVRGAYFALKAGPFPDEIYVMNTDGSRATRLTGESSYNRTPTWSRTPGKAFVPLALPAPVTPELIALTDPLLNDPLQPHLSKNF